MSAVGALLSLDDNVLFRGMFAQPLACGSILGLLIGDLRLGATVGAILQLLWLFDVPAGGFISIDYTSCTTISLALLLPLIKTGLSVKEALVVGLPFFVLIGLLSGALSSHLTKRLRRFNELMVERAVRGVDNGRISSVWRNNTTALLPMFAKAFAIILASILAGLSLESLLLPFLVGHFDVSVHGFWLAALPAAGIGIGLRALREHRGLAFAGISMAAALVIMRLKVLSGVLAAVVVLLGCLVLFLAWWRLIPHER
jgi:mannose/fructose/N-acetylgalactosamine-specific phosphotransferase system component IIC